MKNFDDNNVFRRVKNWWVQQKNSVVQAKLDEIYVFFGKTFFMAGITALLGPQRIIAGCSILIIGLLFLSVTIRREYHGRHDYIWKI